MKSNRGFTLVEVLIALFVFGVITAIAGLNLHAYTLNRNLKSAARDIASDFAVCKQKAISESATYQIIFNVSGGSYTIQTTTGVPPAITKSVTSFGTDITIVTVAFGAASSTTVNFDARGAVTPLGNAAGDRVVLRNSRNSTATITVTAMGRTYVTFNIQ
jgi:prepilin-type N-terminal cleavage/methylation domain-containing protein